MNLIRYNTFNYIEVSKMFTARFRYYTYIQQQANNKVDSIFVQVNLFKEEEEKKKENQPGKSQR